jgi:hypothetical protein
MPTQKPPSDRRLVLAAELRIGGATWEAIAARLHRSPETVRKWPLEYPDRWRTALFHAERRLAADAEGESVLALRRLLRSRDDKVCWHAAKALILLRVELARLDLRALAQSANHTSDPVRLLASLLERHSDEHLAQLVTAEFERAAGVHPVPPGAAAGGPG